MLLNLLIQKSLLTERQGKELEKGTSSNSHQSALMPSTGASWIAIEQAMAPVAMMATGEGVSSAACSSVVAVGRYSVFGDELGHS
jgi:hypothetical protein